MIACFSLPIRCPVRGITGGERTDEGAAPKRFGAGGHPRKQANGAGKATDEGDDTRKTLEGTI